jgi:hypothetical protein
MTPGELMDSLETAGVRFALDPSGEVVIRAPRGSLTDERRAALAEHRAGIGALLGAVGPECWEPAEGKR